MTIRWLFAALHLLALGIGLGAVWARARAFRSPLDAAGLRRVFYADAWWGIAALVWIATGLTRAFGGLEKGSAYYLHNHVFWTKMLLLGVILVLEVLPMLTLLESGRARARMPRTLILEPTRELAAQVEDSFDKYGKNHKLNVALLIGGVSFGDRTTRPVSMLLPPRPTCQSRSRNSSDRPTSKRKVRAA